MHSKLIIYIIFEINNLKKINDTYKTNIHSQRNARQFFSQSVQIFREKIPAQANVVPAIFLANHHSRHGIYLPGVTTHSGWQIK